MTNYEETYEKLFARASELAPYSHDPSRLVTLMENPKWEETGKVHDWRNYIDDAVVEQWDQLDMTARLALYINAAQEAQSEEWD